jgi:hypothetical protein
MHRNTYALVVVLAIFAALVVGVQIGRRLSFGKQSQIIPPPIPSPTPLPTPVPQTYTNALCGFSFQYPTHLTLLEAASGSAVLIDSKNTGNSIAVACQTRIPRPALTPDKVDEVKIGSISGYLYHDANAKDGTLIDKLIFTNPNKHMDIFIAGNGSGFNSIVQSLLILE